jgi:hypothetical protein
MSKRDTTARGIYLECTATKGRVRPMSLSEIATEWEVFAKEGTVGVGAVRKVAPKALTVYIEAYGEVQVTADQIASAHDGKVILKVETFDERTQAAIRHAHDAEGRG